MFSKMEKLFFQILNFGFKDNFDENFFSLLDLLNRNLNHKFKIYYFDNEFVKMFNYNNCMNYINILPNDDVKIVLSKMRLLLDRSFKEVALLSIVPALSKTIAFMITTFINNEFI